MIFFSFFVWGFDWFLRRYHVGNRYGFFAWITCEGAKDVLRGVEVRDDSNYRVENSGFWRLLKEKLSKSHRKIVDGIELCIDASLDSWNFTKIDSYSLNFGADPKLTEFSPTLNSESPKKAKINVKKKINYDTSQWAWPNRFFISITT